MPDSTKTPSTKELRRQSLLDLTANAGQASAYSRQMVEFLDAIYRDVSILQAAVASQRVEIERLKQERLASV